MGAGDNMSDQHSQQSPGGGGRLLRVLMPSLYFDNIKVDGSIVVYGKEKKKKTNHEVRYVRIRDLHSVT